MNKTALITGASSGIGRELAHIFATHGYNLVLVARRKNKLQEIKDSLTNTNVEIIVQDLTAPHAVDSICAQLDAKKIHIDALVNNAGFGVYGNFSSTPIEKESNMVQLNVMALTELTKRLLPHMIHKKCGQILNVASTAAFQPGPHMAVYFASKAYVLSFSEALHEELKSHHIAVTTLCPGPTQTEFENRATEQNQSMSLFKGHIMNAQDVAQIGFAALQKNKAVVITGLKNNILIFLNRFTPRSIVRKIVARIMK